MVLAPRIRTASDYAKEAKKLAQTWTVRKTQFQEWYRLLSLYDENRVAGLESFVANDPRTIYNMALFLLTPPDISYNIPNNEAAGPVQSAIAGAEKLIQDAWTELEESSYRKGQQGWDRYVTSLLLSTGWISVFSYVNVDSSGEPELIADIWNPAQVYPEFDDSGVCKIVHMYTVSASAARRLCAVNEWSSQFPNESPVEIIDTWEYGNDGVENSVLMRGQFVQPPTPHPNLKEIPVLCTPVNGLPDRGLIQNDPWAWRRHMGQAIFAGNSEVFRNYNRVMSFMQQILRDTAQPRIISQTRSKGVVNDSNWAKRGAIYEIDVDEDIRTLQMPGIPIELTSLIQVIQGMIQRGSFSYSLFQGGEASGFAQSQISAAAQNIVEPYRAAISHLKTDISNIWYEGLVRLGKIDKAIPAEAKFKVDIKVSVPGDLIQRATTARQLDSDFELSQTTTTELLFPEITDPNKEMILARRDQAMRSDAMAQLDLIEALNSQADALKSDGRDRQAELYYSYARFVQAQLQAQSQPQQQQLPPGAPGQANAAQQGQ